jgi:hypothetical protein
MPKYIVKRPELHICQVEIEAESPQEAIDKVAEGEGDEISTEYSDTHSRYDQIWTSSISDSPNDSYYEDSQYECDNDE